MAAASCGPPGVTRKLAWTLPSPACPQLQDEKPWRSPTSVVAFTMSSSRSTGTATSSPSLAPVEAVTAATGAKLGEDVAVPVERLLDIVNATAEVGARHGFSSCSWGHAGDGNVHASFLVAPDGPEEAAAIVAADELVRLAVELGGTVAAEHGLGTLKLHRIGDQLGPQLLALQSELKHVFDPRGLLNPGKKVVAS